MNFHDLPRRGVPILSTLGTADTSTLRPLPHKCHLPFDDGKSPTDLPADTFFLLTFHIHALVACLVWGYLAGTLGGVN